MRTNAKILLVAVAVMAIACSGEHGSMMMTGPSGTSGQVAGLALVSVTPAGGATGVSTSTSITIRFAGAMGVAMEQFVDLHVGALSGPTVPMTCLWSGDGTTLTCTPRSHLDHGTAYIVHLGGGMTTPAGAGVDFGAYGPMMGGQWIMGGMMGASHAGSPWGMMGSGWHGANGSYGMEFSFTTA